jgi:hypothetical protein
MFQRQFAHLAGPDYEHRFLRKLIGFKNLTREFHCYTRYRHFLSRNLGRRMNLFPHRDSTLKQRIGHGPG